MKHIKLLQFILVFIASSIILFCQDECPPNDGGCTTWSAPITINRQLSMEGSTWVRLTYRWRLCGTEYQFYYENMEAMDNGGEYDEFSKYHYYFNAFRELTDITLLVEKIESMNTENNGGPDISVPDCNSEIITAKYYVANCGIWVKCIYTLQYPMVRQCDVGYQEPYPDYQDGAVRKVRHYKWQPCGTTCCKKTYHICKEIVNEIEKIKIKAMDVDPIYDCSGQSEYKDAITNQPLQCGNGCR